MTEAQFICWGAFTLYALLLLFVPAAGLAASDALRRHAEAVAAAYQAYRRVWNQRREST